MRGMIRLPYDLKYGHVTLEHGTVPEDEPVVVFRASDQLLPEMLHGYASACEEAGSSDFHVAATDAARQRVLDWQASHPDHVRTPMSAGYARRTGGRPNR